MPTMIVLTQFHSPATIELDAERILVAKPKYLNRRKYNGTLVYMNTGDKVSVVEKPEDLVARPFMRLILATNVRTPYTFNPIAVNPDLIASIHSNASTGPVTHVRMRNRQHLWLGESPAELHRRIAELNARTP